MNFRMAVIAIYWIAIAVIDSIYFLLFSDRIDGVLLGVLLLVRILLLVAIGIVFCFN